MNVTIVLRSALATEWIGHEEAFDALNEASATYPDWAFRLRSGGDVGRYRLEAWKIACPRASSGWLRLEA
jgi:hypothetical protein